MFVRVKTTPNSSKKAVQIVESVRRGDKVSQKIVRHIGYAMGEEEIGRLKLLAETIKIGLEEKGQSLLFPAEKLASLSQPRKEKIEQEEEYQLNVKELIEEARVVSGIHDV